ncbi:hypothetical protein ABL78_5718 [Leptomonas seymouri]|uniref:Uncharacterized protein n=1 Tax=Leptomonas seymouri TaxID=5684 RepID=A0A0N1PC97_LEPSE|nr:hypothetical protein ABL78_5718 [Leptomonas seymouri]|eukprot:KPI85235.1 hypothetical protein ABL78_5718 [Leptomonas seymouri]
MRLEWVKQQLQRRASAAVSCVAPHRRKAAATAHKSSAYIIAEAMEPSGCSCVIVTPRALREKKSAFHYGLRSDEALAPQQVSEQRPSSSHTRSRVTLPGIAPGTILRTRASVAEWVRTSHQLPAPDHYTIVMRGGKRVPAKSGASNPVSLPVLPCRRASDQTCAQCPWMALQERQQFKAAKHKAWNSSLMGAVRNCWTAALSSAKERSVSSDNHGKRMTLHSSQHTYAQVMDCFSFLEPLAIPVHSNRLQALQLQFRRRLQQVELNTATAEESELSGRNTHSSTVEDPSALHLIREGSRAGDEGSLSATDRASYIHMDCPLETLEQKRLIPLLQRWATQLPTSMQERLHSVLISQPSSTALVATSQTSAPHSSDGGDVKTSLHVVLVVESNPDLLGLQSPLCAPAHPADLLSAEEQQLVGAVTSAAPLLANIEVLVCILGDRLNAHFSASAPDACVQVLYPTLDRQGCVEQLQCSSRGGCSAPRQTDSHAKPKRWLDSSPVLSAQCWCEPLGKELQVHLSPYHAALSAVPHTWLTLGGGEELESPQRAPPQQLRASTHACPWVPTFWRHPGALDVCCSVLMSLLLEELEGSAFLINSVATVNTLSPNPAAGQKPCSLDIRPIGGRLAAGARAADIGALAGQRILDTALQALAHEAASFSSSMEELKFMGYLEEKGWPLNSPRRMLLSVNDCSSEIAAIANAGMALEAPLTTPLRLCLYSCTSTMRTEQLSARIASIVHKALSSGNEARVRTGVIDVDPLSSAYVAFAQVDLTCSASQ